MRPFARRSARSREIVVALALALPVTAQAAPVRGTARVEADAADLREEATRSERAIDEAIDADQRMLAYFKAIDAWLRAFAADAELASGCAARSILTRALADDGLDVRAHEELRERFDTRAAKASECVAPKPTAREAPSVALLDPAGPSGARPPAISDRPRPSPRTIVGASVLALAAPALGGLVYAGITDARIAREVRERQAELETTGQHDEARIVELKAKANRALGLEIGCGIASVALLGAGVGLLVTGRREDRARRLAIAPQAGVAFGGVALSGRF